MSYSVGAVICALSISLLATIPSSLATNHLSGCSSFTNCSDVCYPVQPPALTYLAPGQAMTFEVVPVDLENVTVVAFFTSFKGNDIDSNQCDPNNCEFDDDGPRLTVTSFDSSVVGNYRFQTNGACDFPFTISEGVAPTITKETNPPFELDSDAGAFTLSPSINNGTPEAIVHWYKDGVFLQTGDTYTSPTNVQPEDRGYYKANISNVIGNSSVEYEIRVRFSEIIELSSDPVDTHPDITNTGITITCKAIGYPEFDSIGLTANGNSVGTASIDTSLQEGLFYEASAVYMIPSGCVKSTFECSIANGNLAKKSSITICQKAPSIAKVEVDSTRSSNTSIHLLWELDNTGDTGAILGFTVRYRRYGEATYSTVFQPSSSRAYVATNLTPGSLYELSVKLNDNSNSTQDRFYSPTTNFTTFKKPEYKPVALSVTATASSLTLTWMKPLSANIPFYAPISNYQIFYENGSSRYMKTVDGETSQFVLTPYDETQLYTFSVRAVNEWGSGDTSAEVGYKDTTVDETRFYLNVTLTVDVGNNMVILSWTRPLLLDELSRLEVTIERLENRDSGVTLYYITTYNITQKESTSKCFSRLNASEIYRFCIQAYRKDDNTVHPVCTFAATSSSDNDRLATDDSCHPVITDSAVGSESSIPGWAIAAMVVGAVLVVFVFFGGCGLYFGLRRNKQGVDMDYDDTPEKYDPMSPNNGINGGGQYPYPPPPHRATSPPSSRNCMSYRHNNHGHHMDWQA